jgi:hypothetical protein
MALLLGLLLFLLLPVAGASCGQDDGGPAHLCYTGGQLITGDPDLDLSNIFAGVDLRDGIVNTIDLPTAATVMALITAIAVALGVVVAALRRPAIAATAALAGAILVTITEIVTTNGLTDGVSFITTIFGAVDSTDPDTIVSTELGFWLTLTALVTAFIGALIQRRRQQQEDDVLKPAVT